MSLSTFVTLLFAVFAVAAPTHHGNHTHKALKTCNTSNATLDLPSGQTNLTAPAGNLNLSFVTLGVGYQNYSCSSTGAYT